MDVAQLEAAQAKLLPGHLGIQTIEASAEKVVGKLTVAEHHCTVGGILHGGAILALADSLGAVGAFLNLEPGSRTSTVESKTYFLRAAKQGATVTATSRLVNKGRRLMLWQTEGRTENERLVAVVSQSQIILPAGG